jgi:hypothetical protein
VEEAELQMLGFGSSITVPVRMLSGLTNEALQVESLLPDLGLFLAGLLQPRKRPLSVRNHEE